MSTLVVAGSLVYIGVFGLVTIFQKLVTVKLGVREPWLMALVLNSGFPLLFAGLAALGREEGRHAPVRVAQALVAAVRARPALYALLVAAATAYTVFMALGLQYAQGSVYHLIGSLSILFNALLSRILLNQVFNRLHIIAMCLVLAGSIFSTLSGLAPIPSTDDISTPTTQWHTLRPFIFSLLSGLANALQSVLSQKLRATKTENSRQASPLWNAISAEFINTFCAFGVICLFIFLSQEPFDIPTEVNVRNLYLLYFGVIFCKTSGLVVKTLLVIEQSAFFVGMLQLAFRVVTIVSVALLFGEGFIEKLPSLVIVCLGFVVYYFAGKRAQRERGGNGNTISAVK